MSLSTAWGLFRHYCVVIALVLTVVSPTVLILHMPAASAAATLARTMDDAHLARLGGT